MKLEYRIFPTESFCSRDHAMLRLLLPPRRFCGVKFRFTLTFICFEDFYLFYFVVVAALVERTNEPSHLALTANGRAAAHRRRNSSKFTLHLHYITCQ